MKSLRNVFRNGLVKALFIGLIVLSLLCVTTVNRQFAKMDWQEQQLNEYEWAIPLGLYDEIQVAEFDGKVYFLAGAGESGTMDYTVYEADGDTLKPLTGFWQPFLTSDVDHRMTREIHPAGYWITRNSSSSDREYVTDMDRNQLTSKYKKHTLQLTETAGYVINMENRAVFSLDSGKPVYQALENERVTGQMGDYWIMERDIPWPHGVPLTLMYLRNMDFSMALEGMLFDSVYEVEGGKICGTVITTGTYDVLPDEVIAVEERIVEADGSWTKIFDKAGDGVILGAGDGYYVTHDWESEETMLCFLDGSAPAAIEKKMELFGPCRNGIIAFQKQDDLKRGFLNRRGEILIEPIFEVCSTPHQDMAVVVHSGRTGVIRLKGGDGND